MSKLVDRDILDALQSGDIVIAPFDRAALGTNSYDVHLGPELRTYRTHKGDGFFSPLDCKHSRETDPITIDSVRGFTLLPGVLYLGSTVEYTETLAHVPMINGKSSCGRLGLSVHVTAGTGDVGFKGHWTLELTVVHALIVYAGMPVAQLLWDTIMTSPEHPYPRASSKYTNAHVPGPQASEMARNFAKE